MRFLFVPQKENQYHAIAIRKGALAIYVLFLFVFNVILVPILDLNKGVQAASISTSRLVQLANQSRQAAGVPTLSTSSKLAAAATAKANNMFQEQYWAHYGPNGESPWQFIIAAGYNYTYAGENLAKDFVTADAIHNAWMNSPSHRANILNENYDDIGIAAVSGTLLGSETILVVQMFGSQQTSQPIDTPDDSAPSEDESETPTPSGDNTPPEPPVINSPKQGDILNTGATTVRGISEEGSLVSIYDNEKKRADATANEGYFAVQINNLDEGGHDLEADAKDSAGNVSDRSDTITFTVDLTPPALDQENSRVDWINESFEIYLITSDDTVTATASTLKHSTNLLASNIDGSTAFSGILELGEEINIALDEKILITLVDLAGNEATFELETPSKPLAASATDFGGNNLFSNAAAYVRSLTPQQKINIAVAIFLVVLFAVDAAVLWRMGLFREGTKTASHIPILVIAIIASFFGSSGSIKEGLSIF